MVLPVLVKVAVPVKYTHLVGRLAPAGPMLQLEMVLLSLPVVVDPEPNQIFPPFVLGAMVQDPKTVQLVMVLLVASVRNAIVAVPEVADTVVLEIVRAFPPVFKPSKVTLSAPLRSTNVLPAVMAPVMVRAAPPVGLIVMAV